MSRWCNGQHRTLRRSGSRFESGLGYCLDSAAFPHYRPHHDLAFAQVNLVHPRTPARQPLQLVHGIAQTVWRGLRRAAKRDVLGLNVRRAIDAVGGVPRGELVLLVGGCACDAEVVDVVAAELEERDVAVARGNVLGRHGPRAAVAVGLVLAFAR